MDSQGFVFLDVLSNFNRIKQLTQDLEMIRLVCLRSPVIEILTGGDGVERVRRQGDWQQWVMAHEDRDPSVRNDGPSHLHMPQTPFVLPYGDPKAMAMANVPKTAHPGAHFRPEPMTMGEGYHASIPTTETPTNTTPTETPLSATVPDFTPSMQTVSGMALNQSPGLGAQQFPNGSIDVHGGSKDMTSAQHSTVANGSVPGQSYTEK
jgi:hypothetical protein